MTCQASTFLESPGRYGATRPFPKLAIPLPGNPLDWASVRHDISFRHLRRVRTVWSPTSFGLPPGPIGLAHGVVGPPAYTYGCTAMTSRLPPRVRLPMRTTLRLCALMVAVVAVVLVCSPILAFHTADKRPEVDRAQP